MKKILFLTFLSSFAFGISEEELAHKVFTQLTSKLGVRLLNANIINNVLDDVNLQTMLEELNEKKTMHILLDFCEKELTNANKIKKYKEKLSKTLRQSLKIAAISAIATGILHVGVMYIWNAWDDLDKDLRKRGIDCTYSDQGTQAWAWGKTIPREDVNKCELYNQIFRKLLPLEIIAGVVAFFSGLSSILIFAEIKNPNLYKQQIELIQKQVDTRLQELNAV